MASNALQVCPKFSFQNSRRVESCIPFHKASQKSKLRHSTIISFLFFPHLLQKALYNFLHWKTPLKIYIHSTSSFFCRHCRGMIPELCAKHSRTSHSRFLFLWMSTVIINWTESLPQPGMRSLMEWKFQYLRSENSSTNSQILVFFITEPRPTFSLQT